ncbi:LysR family transcriptional regulator [Serratia bockelmannii]|uniref:LysR family transcriptional regulator n=1 Tax=Serratia bockelmannii TaxID=2703793 RepID=UPI00235F7735|nr:LysR family transcriptional regulator [Serratia bockelmannii]
MKNFSPESLQAFQQVVLTGSFTGAARKLKKSQSAISTAVANLEVDLNVALFSRGGRQVHLTDEGNKLLPYIQDLINSSNVLAEMALQVSNIFEPRITIIVSDLWYFESYASRLEEFARKFKNIEVEILLEEDCDTLESIQSRRAQLAFLKSQTYYPLDVAVMRNVTEVEENIYVSSNHTLSKIKCIRQTDLLSERKIHLRSRVSNTHNGLPQYTWYSPSIFIILNLVADGLGWAALPTNYVEKFGNGRLKKLNTPGWPKYHEIDVIWSANHPLGPAGKWLIEQLQKK